MGDKQKILVVDDIETNRIILDEILHTNYTVEQAADGFAAISVLFNAPDRPDLVLLDVMMPEMDGFEVFSIMKNNPLTQNIPVMFITANSGTDSERRALTLGAADFIAKPFEPELVMLRVANCLELQNYRVHLEGEVEKKMQELVRAKENILELLANMLDYRDSFSGEHVKRTCKIIDILVHAMLDTPRFAQQLREENYKVIIAAAPTHDIGKIGIPDSILLKPDRLTSEEYEIVKTHPLIGERIVHLMENSLDDVYSKHCHDMCLYHHERWDGKGYPHGLKEEEIPLAARIMAVVDVYEALTSVRPYKKPFDKETALKMIDEGAGTQFDPDIAAVLLSVSDRL